MSLFGHWLLISRCIDDAWEIFHIEWSLFESRHFPSVKEYSCLASPPAHKPNVGKTVRPSNNRGDLSSLRTIEIPLWLIAPRRQSRFRGWSHKPIFDDESFHRSIQSKFNRSHFSSFPQRERCLGSTTSFRSGNALYRVVRLNICRTRFHVSSQSCNLSSFETKINKHDLISLSS